ncbi:B3/4 domain-containing protein [Streptomyces netropsis]|uniref:B3/4 domain-containing protein n=1 Tax=Streptomyces netropsis TaxID=55404 RepID=UPI0037934B57
MYFTHADSVWTAHPSLHALTMVIDNVLGMKSDPQRLDKLTPKVEERLASGTESEMPAIASWREAFSKMGLKPTQYRCASEALLRRYRKDRSMPSFHPLVDYLNFASMSSAIPIAAFDCAKISEGITVRHADGTETYETFQGDIENPLPNEVVFADPAHHAHSRRWTFRQSARSVVSAQTDRVLIVAEAHHAAAPQDIDALEHELKSGLTEAGVHITSALRISTVERRLEF